MEEHSNYTEDMNIHDQARYSFWSLTTSVSQRGAQASGEARNKNKYEV